MTIHRRLLNSSVRASGARAPRRLHAEPLESRSLLSAVGLTMPTFHAAPLPQVSAILRDLGVAADLLAADQLAADYGPAGEAQATGGREEGMVIHRSPLMGRSATLDTGSLVAVVKPKLTGLLAPESAPWQVPEWPGRQVLEEARVSPLPGAGMHRVVQITAYRGGEIAASDLSPSSVVVALRSIRRLPTTIPGEGGGWTPTWHERPAETDLPSESGAIEIGEPPLTYPSQPLVDPGPTSVSSTSTSPAGHAIAPTASRPLAAIHAVQPVSSTSSAGNEAAAWVPDPSGAWRETNASNQGSAAPRSVYESAGAAEASEAWAAAIHGAAANSEGGFVEIGAGPASPRSFKRPAPIPFNDAEERDFGKSNQHKSVDEDLLDHRSNRAEDDAALDEDRPEELAAVEGLAQTPAFVLDSPEGGMIELASVASSADSLGEEAIAVGAIFEESAATVQEIRMDRGIALYHAFELATVPGQHGDETAPVLETVDAASLPFDEASSPKAPNLHLGEEHAEAKGVEELSPSRAGMSALVAAALLALLDPLRLEEKRGHSGSAQAAKGLHARRRS